MPGPIITMTIDDKGLMKALKKRKLGALINKHGARQLLGVATFVRNEIKRRIRSGDIDGPALGVQQYIKGHKRLLYHTGGFASAAKFKYIKGGLGQIGVEVGWMSGATSTGLSYPDLATILEEGNEWEPSEAQRIAVAIKAKEAGAPPPSGDRKRVWTTPKRPFLEKILNDDVVLNKFEIAGEKTLDRALKEFMGL